MDKGFTKNELIDYILYKLDIDMRKMAFPAHLEDKILSVSVKVTFDSGSSANHRIDDIAGKVKEFKTWNIK